MADELKITAEQFADLQAKAGQVELLTAKLGALETARKELEDKFTAEQKLRRLAEFVEQADEFSALAVKPDELGAHLLWLADADATATKEHYAYFQGVLKAADAAAASMFTTIGSGRGPDENTPAEPFMAAVEKVRVERFKAEPYAQGFSKAFDVASQEQPDLARQYALSLHGRTAR